MDRPKSKYQGKAVAERQEDGSYLVMYPNGDVVFADDVYRAERLIRAWFKKHADVDSVNVGQITWQSVG